MRCSNGQRGETSTRRGRRALKRLRALAAGLLVALLLAACGDDSAPDARPRAVIVRATLLADPGAVLDVTLDLGFSPVMLEALERGIPLELELVLAGRAGAARLDETRTLRLRYLPLARRWQLRDASGAERHFARRAQLLAALDRVRIPLGPEWLALRAAGDFRLTLSLDTSALPGPLRLPALLRRDWHLPTASYAWHAAG